MDYRISDNHEKRTGNTICPLKGQPDSTMVFKGRERQTGCSFSYPLLNVSSHCAAYFIPKKASVESHIPGKQIQNIRIEGGNMNLLFVPWGEVHHMQPLVHSGVSGYCIDVLLSDSYDNLVTEKVTDTGQISGLIHEAIAFSRIRVSAWGDAGRFLQINDVCFEEEQSVLSFDDTALTHPDIGNVLKFEFDWEGASYHFFGGVIVTTKTGTKVRVPRLLYKTNRREIYRSPLPRDRGVLMMGLSPFGSRIQYRPVIDITGSGMAFPINSQSEVLLPGSELKDFQVVFPNGVTIMLNGMVRSLRPLPVVTSEGYTHLCGIEFCTIPVPQRIRLADAIFHLKHPNVEDATGRSFNEIWRCLNAAGFLYSEKKDKLRPVMPQLRKTVSTMLARPNQISKTLVFLHDNELIGHLSAHRIYSRTLLCHHLAVVSGKCNKVSAVRELNLGLLEYMEQIPEMEWVRVYFRPTNPWAQRVFGSLSDRLNHLPVSDIYLLDYFCSPVHKPGSYASSIAVRTAEDNDLELIEQYFAQHRPYCLCSDDCSKERLHMKEISAAYETAGLHRERRILIADRKGQPAAFAFIEISSIGLNFSELTNTFRVYAFDDDGESKQALIHAAHDCYQQLGRKFVFALGETGDRQLYEACGFNQTKQYACWSWHRSTFRTYYEHILSVTERR